MSGLPTDAPHQGLALIAGRGGLPRELAAVLPAPPLVCAPAGTTPDGLAVDVVFHLERLAPFLRELARRGITRVALAGAVDRPQLDPALCDPETASLMPALLGAMAGGDDATLRALIALLESFDLTVLGLADLAPGLLVGPGPLTRPPTAAEAADAERGAQVLAALGAADVGQACVVAARLVLGVEALYGTDALLADVAARRASRQPQRGGVLVKRMKPGQDPRADLPAIGPQTVVGAVAAGLTGICLQAGRVVILDRPATLAVARSSGLSLWSGA
jgi:UDP-2,3-diacylglucosamine hydrolase